MSFHAKLIIDGIEVNLLKFNYKFQRKADITNKPCTKPHFKNIYFEIETRKDLHLVDWAIARNETKQLELHIYPRILGGKTRILKLYDCHLLYWENHFSKKGTAPLIEKLIVSCGGIKDSNSSVEYSAYWRVTYDNNIEPTVLEEENEEIIDCYYTDLEDNKQTEPLIGQEVYLVLKTKGMEGKTTDIDLSNHTKDFIYNGTVLENDIIKDFKVTSTTHKLKLKAITQQEGKRETVKITPSEKVALVCP